ncbi:MAG: DUF1553 domain-containing protein [Pirellula sp.]
MKIAIPKSFHIPQSTVVAGFYVLVVCMASFSLRELNAGAPTNDLADDSSKNAVRSILSIRCAGCHNASEKRGGLDLTERAQMLSGGDSGVAFNPQTPRESLIWKRIESGEMPPKQPLSVQERDVLSNWIQSGGPWPGERLDPMEFTSETRAGYNWWSLQPLRASSLAGIEPQAPAVGVPTPVAPTDLRPAANASNDSSNPIDDWVDKRLAEKGMRRSPQAALNVLLRRMSYHVTGLPPAQPIVNSTANSNIELIHAYIDQLLDSPEFGQRWARHWLDTVRFGESHGFERDQLRSNAWRYRDWVVHALNTDMPYDRFASLQIAGDALESTAAHGHVATGMLVCGPYDQVGQTQQSKAMREIVRQDELEDFISVVCQSFLGLTVNCSRCHDHKFDPIPQREYYRISAALAGTHHGEVQLESEHVESTSQPILERLRTRKSEVSKEIESIEGKVRVQILADRRIQPPSTDPPIPISRWDFDNLKDSLGGLDLDLRSNATLRDGRLHVGGTGFAVTKNLKKELREKTLEAWVQLSNLGQSGGAAISLETEDGAVFDGIVFGEREPKRWVVGSNFYSRSDSLGDVESESSVNETVHVAFVYASDGSIRAYRNGHPYGMAVRKSELVAFLPKTSHVLFGLRHSPAAESKILQGSIERAQLYDRALSSDEVLASARSQFAAVSTSEILARLEPAKQEALTALRFELNQIDDQIQRTADRRVYAVASKAIPKTFVLARGNTSAPLDVVQPGGVSAIQGPSSDFPLDDSAPDKERRQALAGWIASDRNPLFARVIVNRVWHHYFGVGIVATPNDFGFNGGRPSHPELLDWLAQDLIAHGWSLKHLHRRILTSETYQQASSVNAEYLAKDADNRLLWRHTPTRLDAESLRDTILLLAGKLDCSLDGPGYYDFEFTIHNSHFYFMRDPLGDTFQRRTLYRTLIRSARSNLLDVFDCPDPSTKTPQRSATTTPLQSLALMNNSFVVRMADAWAEKVMSMGIGNEHAQVQEVFRQALGRKPESNELSASISVSQQHGLATVCRALLNCNELLYVD